MRFFLRVLLPMRSAAVQGRVATEGASPRSPANGRLSSTQDSGMSVGSRSFNR
jgi:hypothetical protein